jgi:probable rRNA maturation factor
VATREVLARRPAPSARASRRAATSGRRRLAGRSLVSVGGRNPALPVATVRRAVRAVLEGEDREATISVTFLGPRLIRRLNARHRNHDFTTDVLSFPLILPDGRLVGDIYVCRSVAADEARRRHIPLRQELLRLVIHGVLHILGYQHSEGAGRERSTMWRKQERYVNQLDG